MVVVIFIVQVSSLIDEEDQLQSLVNPNEASYSLHCKLTS